MRIAGITIPDNKRLEIALTAVYGVGRPMAKRVLDANKVDHGAKAADLGEKDEVAIRKTIEDMQIEGDLKRNISGNIKRLIDIKAYRGTRHAKKLPARGQNTKTNSRTRRGNSRVTMGSGRVKVSKT